KEKLFRRFRICPAQSVSFISSITEKVLKFKKSFSYSGKFLFAKGVEVRSSKFYLPNSCGLRGVYLSRFSSNKARWNKACPRASSVFGSAYFFHTFKKGVIFAC
ncbi:hypothetical protein, partial [uncultured Treponema sp.]|uniref:hypothetical protein n=1 Tax=uncultured Treponema sp. TaxID=162155 RepID=UPI002586F281